MSSKYLYKHLMYRFHIKKPKHFYKIGFFRWAYYNYTTLQTIEAEQIVTADKKQSRQLMTCAADLLQDILNFVVL